MEPPAYVSDDESSPPVNTKELDQIQVLQQRGFFRVHTQVLNYQ